MDRTTVVKEMLKLMTVLDSLHGDISSNLLKEEDKVQLQEFQSLITPHLRPETDLDERLNVATKHLISYLDAENTPVIGTTYSHLSQLISRISDSGVLSSDQHINSMLDGHLLNGETSNPSMTSCAESELTCRVCLKSFSSAEHRRQHESFHFCHPVSSEHRSQDFRVIVACKNFACFKCDRKFFTVPSRTEHQKRHFFCTYKSGTVCRSWMRLTKKACVKRDAKFTCKCGKVFRYYPCFLIHWQCHGFAANSQKDGAKSHFVTRKAQEKECNDETPHYVDSLVDHLYGRQDDAENHDDLLLSLEGSTLDDLTGAATVVQLDPITFVCTACGTEFLSKTEANSHVRLHWPGKSAVCTICGKAFLDGRNLRKHQMRHVPLSNRPKCSNCGARFLMERCRQRHVDGSFQHRRCTLCGSVHRLCPALCSLTDLVNPVFTAEENLAPDSPTVVEQTRSEIRRPKSRRISSKTARTVRSRVPAAAGPVSNRFSRSTSAMERHTLWCNGVRIHECPDCGKIFQSRGNLVRHFRQHTGERPFACLECGRTFVDHGNMKKHSRVHRRSMLIDSVDLSEIQLDGSGAATDLTRSGSDSAVLNSVASELLEIKTEMITELLPTQSVADDQTVTPPSSSKWSKSVGNGSYTCFVCNKMFPYKSSLEEHMRAHVDHRPYQCEVCGKAFKRTCDLLVHSRSHDQQKRFECRVCGKRFRWKNGLDRHRLVHTGERPFLCTQCGQSLADRGSLRQHMRRHSGIRPSFPAERCVCTLCSKSFAWKRGLDRHIKQAHCWDAASTSVPDDH